MSRSGVQVRLYMYGISSQRGHIRIGELRGGWVCKGSLGNGSERGKGMKEMKGQGRMMC